MDGVSSPAAGGRAAAAVPVPVATVAKGALRRLAQAHLEPTPENYARAYAEEAGLPPPAAPANTAPQAAASAPELRAQGQAWAALLERVVRGLDRGGRQWTAARRKDSLKRVLEGSRSDPHRLLQRLQSLMGAWESDQAADPAQTGLEPLPSDVGRADAGSEVWRPVLGTLHGTLGAALPLAVPRAEALADQLKRLADALASEGPTPELAAACDTLCEQARRFFGHRHHLIDELSALCRELTAGLVELAEDESWARGQALALQHTLEDDGASVRGVRAAGVLLAETRTRQQRVRAERQAAREALKQLIHDMVVEVGELGDHAGRFQLATAQHAQAIEQAHTLEGLTQVVQALLHDTRAVQSAVGRSQERLQADRARADALEGKVRELEGELRRLSDEVSTDALTQVANRRGLDQAFEVERARCERESGAALAVGLIDIDNFKKLNDSLGHAAGDIALKSLAAAVRERLRPVDHLARFGGEEFVLLLPGLPDAEAQQVMTRLQRSLSEALFLHDGREVFITFSGGVTSWRAGETLQAALERADEALYEAKRTGKNRTCIA
ncbi:diguanylate cyclase [beta proteobacterium AAP121]|nr:diguanylate cyclase [beta proteobacterium AAP65]KPF98898.1 diguanylate cyclase [beta proteobacterium AAP121]